MFQAFTTNELAQATILTNELGIDLMNSDTTLSTRDRFIPSSSDDQAVLLIALRAMYGPARRQESCAALRHLGDARRVLHEQAGNAQSVADFVDDTNDPPTEPFATNESCTATA